MGGSRGRPRLLPGALAEVNPKKTLKGQVREGSGEKAGGGTRGTESGTPTTQDDSGPSALREGERASWKSVSPRDAAEREEQDSPVTDVETRTWQVQRETSHGKTTGSVGCAAGPRTGGWRGSGGGQAVPDLNMHPGTPSCPQKFATTGSGESPLVRAKLIHIFALPREVVTWGTCVLRGVTQSLRCSSVRRGLSLSGQTNEAELKTRSGEGAPDLNLRGLVAGDGLRLRAQQQGVGCTTASPWSRSCPAPPRATRSAQERGCESGGQACSGR